MSPSGSSRPRRRARRDPEAEPAEVAVEMEEATQRLRDQAWKINAVTRTPLISEDAIRSTSANAASQP